MYIQLDRANKTVQCLPDVGVVINDEYKRLIVILNHAFNSRPFGNVN
jgi:hypothetical protein